MEEAQMTVLVQRLYMTLTTGNDSAEAIVPVVIEDDIASNNHRVPYSWGSPYSGMHQLVSQGRTRRECNHGIVVVPRK